MRTLFAGVLAGLFSLALIIVGIPQAFALSGDISDLCREVDVTSPESVFACMGTMRRDGSRRNIFEGNIGTSDCSSLTRSWTGYLLKEGLDRKGLSREEVEAIGRPSCEIFAQTVKMMTGKPASWTTCIGYSRPGDVDHMRRCMTGFVPLYSNTRPEKRAGNCDNFRDLYRIALRAASPDQKTPEGYEPPDCADALTVIAEWSGGTAGLRECSGYDPSDVERHLVSCLLAGKPDLRRYRDCMSIRQAYEERLREANGELPDDYTILACSATESVLAAVEEERTRLADEHRDREQRLEQEREARLEEQRAKIRERQAHERPTGAENVQLDCDIDIGRFSDLGEFASVAAGAYAQCIGDLSQDGFLFMMGMAQELAETCHLPPSPVRRLDLATLLSAAPLAAGTGRRYAADDLGAMGSDAMRAVTSYEVGRAAISEIIGCAQVAATITEGIYEYFDRTRASSRFADECEVHYAGRYSRDQCTCVGDLARLHDPQIHSKAFSRRVFSRIGETTPFAMVQGIFQCGFTTY